MTTGQREKARRARQAQLRKALDLVRGVRKTKRSTLVGGTVIDRVKGVDIRLTSENQIFCSKGLLTVFPSLKGSSMVAFDERIFKPSAELLERLKTLFRKQKHLRMTYWRRDDDPATFYNYH
jgi:hypothetical protein